jgi:hypothetical protein
MPFQPNPFVNPNSRDVQLPGGCKDLHEVLLKAGGKSGYEVGGFAALKVQLRNFYQSKLNAVLIIGTTEPYALMSLTQVQGEFILSLRVRKEDCGLPKAIAQLFGKDVVSESHLPKLKVVNLRLPAWWEEAGHKVMELLIHGYGVTDESRLWFDLHYRLYGDC